MKKIILILFVVILTATACTNATPTETAATLDEPTESIAKATVVEETTANPVVGTNPLEETPVIYAYPNIDTGQVKCYDNQNEIPCPEVGAAFFGQDATYTSIEMSFVDNGDGTVSDLNTGLIWMRNAGEKMSYAEALDLVDGFSFAGYDDWRIPTIKELYSLMDFSGIDDAVSGTDPFIDTEYFVFEYGDPDAGEREIDSQWITNTVYESTVMNNQQCFFGVNFADGRIKCYPTNNNRNNGYYLRLVRGEQGYGDNKYIDNGNGTITDLSVGLTWQQDDSAVGMDWEEAIQYCETLTLAGETQWRVPNAKELQYIVDYSQSPDTTNSPAIDSIFNTTQITNELLVPDWGYFWTSTTHENDRNGSSAVYISFGEAIGQMNGEWMDVHGAGAQRSDTKIADTYDTLPYSHGPQGDSVRVYNYVRCVSDAEGVNTEIVVSTQPTGNSLLSGESSAQQSIEGNEHPHNGQKGQPR